MAPYSASTLLHEARVAAGLSQRALARRAGTTQSVVARIERRQTSPSWDTLVRLVAAAGFELRPGLAPRRVSRSHMLADVKRILSLSPEERLNELRNVARFVAAARRA